MLSEVRLAAQNSVQQRRIEEVQRGLDPVREFPHEGGLPWHMIPFGWSRKLVAGAYTAGKIRVLTGSVYKHDETPVSIGEADVTIGTSETYVGAKIKRDLTSGQIITDTTRPVTDQDWVTVWWYIFQKVTGEAFLKKINWGHLGDWDISPYTA